MDRQLDALVRRADGDRWLASGFAPARARARLRALYALNYEIARIGEIVTEPGVGDIRLAWWRDALAEVCAGVTPRAHPALEAFRASWRETILEPMTIQALIAARRSDLDPAPFKHWAALESYVDATAVGLMRLAFAACGADADAHAELARSCGRAWGFTGLARALPHWRARGRALLPPEADEFDLRARARGAFAEAREHAAREPSALFPAYGYVALTPGYLRGLERGESEAAGAPLFVRHLKLIGAAAGGRL